MERVSEGEVKEKRADAVLGCRRLYLSVEATAGGGEKKESSENPSLLVLLSLR